MAQRINIYEIAKEAGVSTATVSRVVSGHPSVREETRVKVMRVVEKYGYRPSQIATGLLKKSAHALCLAVPTIENPFYTKVFSAAQQRAEQLEYSLQMIQIERIRAFSHSFADDLIGRRVDGVIFSGDITNAMTVGTFSEMVDDLQRHMPVVVINPLDDSVDTVRLCSNIRGSVVTAARHLHTLGHRRIALVGGTGRVQTPNSREQGYLDALAELGLEGRGYPFTDGEYPTHGEACVQRLFSAGDRALWPTGLVMFNDLVAMGALRELERMKLRVPEDIAVVSFDNQFYTPYLKPALTTIDLRIETTAAYAVELLVNAAGNRIAPFQQTFDSVLVVRESCGAELGKRPLA